MKNINILVFVMIFLSCNKKVEDLKPICETKAVIDQDIFDKGPKDELKIKAVSISDDCISITFTAGGGCNDDLWKETLVMSLEESYFRKIRLAFDDKDTCKALVEKTVTFDLTPFRVEKSNSVPMELSGWDETLTYNY